MLLCFSIHERPDTLLQGHLRLVLLPVVYNAMQAKEELRATPLFSALSRAMRRSTYFPLLQPPAADSGSRRSSTDQLPLPAAAANESQDDPTGWGFSRATECSGIQDTDQLICRSCRVL